MKPMVAMLDFQHQKDVPFDMMETIVKILVGVLKSFNVQAIK